MTDNKMKAVRIIRTNPNNVTPIHVNDMVISSDGKEFFLTFFEIEPPLLEEDELEKIETVEAVARFKIVISPNFAKAISKVLSENIGKYIQGDSSNG